jgi:NADH-quinone oxidoreductase subunit N
LSLLGLPPLAGFPAKVLIFYALVDAAGAAPAFRMELYALFVIGGLNTALSLFYYLRVVKVMILDPEPDDRLPAELPLASIRGAYLVVVTAPVLVLGIWWNELNLWARTAAAHLLS